MKRTLAGIWLGFLAVALLSGGRAAVALDGVVALGNLQCAVLVLDGSMSSAGRSFVLATGETLYGVRLLGVDMHASSVQIENEGRKLTLRLHSAPDVAGNVAAMEAAQAAADAPEGQENLPPRAPVNTALIPGNPGWGTLPPSTHVAAISSAGGNSVTGATASGQSTVASVGTGTAGVGAGFQTGAGNGVAALASGSQPPASPPDWYVESAAIEQERNATAQQVTNGDLAPLPRTPLTPPGTPANLVDNLNGVYSNHNQDFLTQSWSQM